MRVNKRLRLSAQAAQLQAVYSGVCLENAGSKGEFCAEDQRLC